MMKASFCLTGKILYRSSVDATRSLRALGKRMAHKGNLKPCLCPNCSNWHLGFAREISNRKPGRIVP